MTEEQLKKERIDQATINYLDAEAAVDVYENDTQDGSGYANRYFKAMCRFIVSEQIYDQIIHFYQVSVKVTKEEAKRRFDWRMRKRYFLIKIKKSQINLLESELFRTDGPDRSRIEQELIDKYIALGEMIRQANAFEFRSTLSIDKED